ncbi:DUF6011 domain-containing protein [Streptomyces sp. NPDC053705]|uniref:DUF6011 domain-containing protein n=1 Tax=unclassified Streptomyces TaxID=2593676 RepID=UPI00343DB2F4
MADTHTTQPTLDGTPIHRYRYCRRCGRPLTAEASRRIGYGDECNPTRHPTPAATRQVDQDQLPED